MTTPGTSYQWKKFGHAPVPRFPGVSTSPRKQNSDSDAASTETEMRDANRDGYEAGYAAGLAKAEEEVRTASLQQVAALKTASQEVLIQQRQLQSNLLEEVLEAVQGCFTVLFAHELTLNPDLLQQLKSIFEHALGDHADRMTILLSPTDHQLLGEHIQADESLILEVDSTLPEGIVRARTATLLAELNLPEQLRGLLEEFAAHQRREDDNIDHS